MRLGERIIIDKDGNLVIDEHENVQIVGSSGETLMDSEKLQDMMNETVIEEAGTLLGATDAHLTESVINPVVMTETVDMSEVVESLDKVNYSLVALLCVILYVICEQKIKSGIRRVFKANG